MLYIYTHDPLTQCIEDRGSTELFRIKIKIINALIVQQHSMKKVYSGFQFENQACLKALPLR